MYYALVLVFIGVAAAQSTFCSANFKDDPEYPYKQYQYLTAYKESDRGDITQYQTPDGEMYCFLIFIWTKRVGAHVENV